VQWQAGDTAARDTFVRAAAEARERGDAVQLGRAALGVRGQHTPAGIVDDELIALLEEALAAVGGERGSLRAELLARLGDAHLFAGPERAVELTAEAVAVARAADDAGALLTALGARHGALLAPDRLEERLAVSRERRELAAARGRGDMLAAATRWEIYDLYESGRIEDARTSASALADLAEELRQPLYHHFTASWGAVDSVLRGEFPRAEELIATAATLGHRAQARDADMNRVVALLMMRREQGRAGELAEAISAYAEHFPVVPAWRVLAAHVAMVTGDEATAARELELHCRDGCTALPRDLFLLPALAALAEIAAATGSTTHAAGLYELLEPYADRWVVMGLASNWGSAERYLGLAALAAGQAPAARAHLERAAEQHASAGARPLLARTLTNVADAAAADGDHARANAALAEAEPIARQVGMPALLAEIERFRAVAR